MNLGQYNPSGHGGAGLGPGGPRVHAVDKGANVRDKQGRGPAFQRGKVASLRNPTPRREHANEPGSAAWTGKRGGEGVY